MFGLGFGELIVLSLILLVLIGPKQLPEVMKQVAKFVRDISKAQNELKQTVDQDDSLRSIRESVNEVKHSVKHQVDQVTSELKTDFDDESTEETKK